VDHRRERADRKLSRPDRAAIRPRWRVRALTRVHFDLLDFAAVEREFKKTGRNSSSIARRSDRRRGAEKSGARAAREC
jgi:hypothetical protein